MRLRLVAKGRTLTLLVAPDSLLRDVAPLLATVSGAVPSALRPPFPLALSVALLRGSSALDLPADSTVEQAGLVDGDTVAVRAVPAPRPLQQRQQQDGDNDDDEGAARVESVSPAMGPTYGGVLVDVAGRFPLRVSCVSFGGSVVPASPGRSSGCVRAVAPAHPPGAVAVEVSHDGREWTRSGVVFTYVSPRDIVHPARGKPVCCHVGDRRCLTMDDCDWVNWIEKAPEPRNCECIATNHSSGSAKRWDSCQRTAECDPGLTTDNKRLGCRLGDRRCLTKDDCDWVNWIGHTNNDCSVIKESCFNGVRDGSEPDVDCGKACPTKCGWGLECTETADCPANGVCRHLGVGTRHVSLCVNPSTNEGVPSGSVNEDHCFNRVRDAGESDVDCGKSVWNARTSEANRLPPPWSRTIHGSVDVKAIDISRPSKKQDKFYNGKYKGHVVKIQVVVNNQGIPMDVQGLYEGGKPVCCHVGDRRCLTMDDCDWVNWVEKAPEPRNCECIATNHSSGSAKRWDSCQRTAECDPGLTTDNKRLGCRMGDRRCLTKDDCDWVNWAGHTNNDCSVIKESCFNGVRDGSEPDVDCGKACPTKCGWGLECTETADCPANGVCRHLGVGTRHVSLCVNPSTNEGVPSGSVNEDHCFNGVRDAGESDVDCGKPVPDEVSHDARSWRGLHEWLPARHNVYLLLVPVGRRLPLFKMNAQSSC
eukprot:m51a1_g10860 hypothetical protein (704) ;mRNA; r:4089-23025